MPFQAQNDTVLIVLDHEEKTTESGLILTQRELPKFGKVVSVGPGYYDNNGRLVPIDVEVGDTIYFEHATAYGVEIEGDKYVSVPRHGILAVVHSNA